MDYKITPLFKQTVEERTVTGYASIMGNVDDGGDITHPGAFSKTLKENGRRIRHLWQHDMYEPPTAVIKSLREVGRGELPADLLAEFPTASGALEVAREYLDTPRGNEILSGIKAGAISEMSFGYDIIKKDFSSVEGKSVRNLREIRLFETSDVQWGMNPATRASKSVIFDLMWAIRAGQDVTALLQAGQTLTSDDLTQVQQAISMLLNLLANIEPPSDPYEMMGALIGDQYAEKLAAALAAGRDLLTQPEALKVGRVISAANVDKLKRAITELQEVLDAAEPPQSEALTDGKALIARLAIAEREFIQWGGY